MGEPSVVKRVESLEKNVRALRRLPGAVAVLAERMGAAEVQIVRLRSEILGEFSAVRSELAQAKGDLLEVIDSSSKATQSMSDDVSKDLVVIRENLAGVRKTMATSNEMHRLHDVILERLDRLGSRP